MNKFNRWFLWTFCFFVKLYSEGEEYLLWNIFGTEIILWKYKTVDN